jgi:hypothetical protein
VSDLTGQLVGDYVLEAPLGQGATGQVYRARHVRLQRPAALKLLVARPTAVPGFQASFSASVRRAAALRHPHIVEIYDFGEQDGRYYLSMELLSGSLRELLRQRNGAQRALQFPLLLALARQAAEALVYAHEQGVIHGAIKPENLLLRAVEADAPQEATTLKIADFGLAHLLPDEALSAPAYLSPEQCRGLATDASSDIYSLGVVLYELATGVPPFIVGSVAEAARQHLYVPPVALRTLNPEVPLALEVLILRCLAKQPQERFASAGELLGALRLLVDQQASARQVPLGGVADEVLLGGLLGVPPAAVAQAVGGAVRVEFDREQVFLTPGEQTAVTLRVSNTGRDVDAYTLEVEGVPGSWVAIPDPPLLLAPGKQAAVVLLVTPPRTQESRAGSYQVALRVRSATAQEALGTAHARWDVQAYSAASLSLAPPQAESRSEASYRVLLRNEGNADATFRLAAGEQSSSLTYRFAQNEVPLAPGQALAVPLQIAAPKRLLGDVRLHTFEVRAEAADYVARSSAEFKHWPAVRSWVPAVLLGVVLLGVLVGRMISAARSDDAAVGEVPAATELPTPTPTDEPGAPRVALFSVVPQEAGPSDLVLVSWDVQGAERVVIDRFGDVPAQGQREFRPEETTEFRLVAQGGGKETVRVERVTVARPPDAPVPEPTTAPAPPTPEPAPPPTTAPAPPTPEPAPPPTTAPAPPTPEPAPPQPEPTLALPPDAIRFAERAEAAAWQTNGGEVRFGRPLLGAARGGWADLSTGVVLENGRLYESALYLFPPLAASPAPEDEPYIEGQFAIEQLEAGQFFQAEVGFAQAASVGEVTVRISLDDELVYQGEQRLDGNLDTLSVDLSRFAGSDRRLTLRVSPLEGALSDGIYWVEPRLVAPGG